MFMLKFLDALANRPSVWLTVFGCGSVMSIASVAQAFGVRAAGTVSGFLILSGAIGYEILSRQIESAALEKKLRQISQTQETISQEFDALRKNVPQTEQNKKQTPTPPPSASRPLGATKPLSAAMPSSRNRFRDLAEMVASRKMGLKQTDRIEEDLATPDLSPPTPQYSDAVMIELLNQAVQNERIEVFAQPVVRLPSRRLAYLELFARLRARAGIYLAASQYRPLAESKTIIQNVDHLLLLHVFDTLRSNARRGISVGYFINISSRSLRHAAFVNNLVAFAREHRSLAPSLIFEFQQADFDSLPTSGLELLNGLSRLGCRFSLDHVETPRFDVKRIEAAGISFLKMEASRLVDMAQTDEGATLVRRLKTALDRSGIEMIVEKIEDERAVVELLDFEVDYGEGYLFGKPDHEAAYRLRQAA
jgi:EAL domain-containing protein (putative c-di-GMP-specific phosphodiesterase class I)